MNRKRPETITAERLAALLEAPETPPAVRDIIRQGCAALDMAATVCDCTGDCTGACSTFRGRAVDITPAQVRRKLPALMRKVGHYRAHFYVDGLELFDPDKKGGE